MNLNIVIDAAALAVLVFIRLSGLAAPRKSTMQRLFDAMVIITCAGLLVDICGWQIDGKNFENAAVCAWVFNSLYYILQIIQSFLWLAFSDYWAHRDENRLLRRSKIYVIPALLEIGLVGVNFFTHWLFDIDAQNTYIRGDFYLINLLPYAFYVFGAIAVMLMKMYSSADILMKRQSTSMIVFMFMPAMGMFVIMFICGVSVTWPFDALGLLVIYKHSTADTVRGTRKPRKGRKRSRGGACGDYAQPDSATFSI